MALIRSVSGIRGLVGDELDHQAVYRHTLAFAELQPPGPILLARDSRPHGAELLKVVSAALRQAHRQAVTADLVPTPTAQFLIPLRRLAGGIVLTASHNPIEYNGMKFMGSDGCFIGSDKCSILFSRADQIDIPDPLPVKCARGSDLIDGAGYHILNILDLGCIDAAAIMRRRFKVVVDTVNGAAFFALPALLEALGCAVVRLHCNPDGTFPRGTEPVPANLTDLGAAVVLHGADLGMATDPDADRLALVDEDGQPLGEDLTQVLAIDGFLRRTGNQQPVVTNLSSSLLLDRICERHGVEVKRSAVGEINVVNVMRAAGSLIGGEGNGGVILAESHLGRDSLVGAALVLDRLAQQTMTIGAVRDSYPKFEIVKDKVSIAGLNPEGVTGHIAAAYTNVQQDTVDGLKLLWGDRWVHVRKSNTEAVIRIIAEAPDAAAARQLADDVKQLVMEMPVKGPQ